MRLYWIALPFVLSMFWPGPCAHAFLMQDPTESTRSVPKYERVETEAVNDAFEQVFSDPVYRRLLPEEESVEPEFFLSRWLQQFVDWLDSLFARGQQQQSPRGGGRPTPGSGGPGLQSVPTATGMGGIAKALTYTIVFVMIVGALALIVRAIILQRGRNLAAQMPGVLSEDEALAPTVPPGEIPCDEYERRALEFAEAGDYKGAVRQLVLGSMSWIEREGLIRYRKGLTNRDYLRSLYRDMERRSSMDQIVRVFELIFYGRRTADVSSYHRCLDEYRGAFRAQKEAVPN